MNAPGDQPDELAGTEQPFVSHLIELRDRLVRAAIAVAVCFGALALWPGPSGLYDLLAAPLVANLPQGTTLIARATPMPPLCGAPTSAPPSACLAARTPRGRVRPPAGGSVC